MTSIFRRIARWLDHVLFDAPMTCDLGLKHCDPVDLRGFPSPDNQVNDLNPYGRTEWPFLDSECLVYLQHTALTAYDPAKIAAIREFYRGRRMPLPIESRMPPKPKKTKLQIWNEAADFFLDKLEKTDIHDPEFDRYLAASKVIIEAEREEIYASLRGMDANDPRLPENANKGLRDNPKQAKPPRHLRHLHMVKPEPVKRKIKAVLPSSWVYPLIMDDWSNVADDEANAIRAWLKLNSLKSSDLMGEEDDEHYATFHAAWVQWPWSGNCVTFTFEARSPDFKVNEDGATVIEYGLLAGVLAVIVIVALHFVGLGIGHAFSVIP